jgi:hypothetical protein
MPRVDYSWLNWLPTSDRKRWGELEVAYRDCIKQQVEIKGEKADLRAKAKRAEEEFIRKRAA